MWQSAKQITPRARRWLRISHSARILHLFSAVCTLVNEEDEVISLVTPDTGPGPFTVILEGNCAVGLDADQKATIDNAGQTLAVGSLLVDLSQATVWQPKPDWVQLRHADRSEWPPASLPPVVDIFLDRVVRSIVTDDLFACRAGVEGLAGRGGGLTPTGDDVLVGVLYALWAWHPQREWLEMIRQTAVPRTTILSGNFISAAADGEAVWQWHDLVNGRPGAVDHILSIGHRSGADAWAGFASVASVFNSSP